MMFCVDVKFCFYLRYDEFRWLYELYELMKTGGMNNFASAFGDLLSIFQPDFINRHETALLILPNEL